MITIKDFIEQYNLDPEPFKECFINGHYIGIYEDAQGYWTFCTGKTGATLCDQSKFDVVKFEEKYPIVSFKRCEDFDEVQAFVTQHAASFLMN